MITQPTFHIKNTIGKPGQCGSEVECHLISSSGHILGLGTQSPERDMQEAADQ